MSAGRQTRRVRSEVLGKVLGHNICVVIQSRYELGFEPVFRQDKPTELPAVLPMVRRG